MKIILFSVVLFALTFCATAQIVTNEPSRLKTKVTCYEGKIDSGERTSSEDFAPDNTYPGGGGGYAVTSPGHECNLKWSFVGRNGDKDVYHFTFTRTTKAGSSGKITTSKEIQFDGKQIIVFEDDLHAVVMESPSAEDLKSAQKH
jgi:hypothetical protein